METLGERIKKLRGTRTGKSIAESAAITPAFYSEIERGVKMPSMETLKNLAAVLNTSVGYLVGETDDPSIPVKGTQEFSGKRKSQAAIDFEEMIRDLAQKNPDVAVLLRDTREHWDEFSDRELQAIADGLAFVFGKTTAEQDKRMKKEGRFGKL